MLQLVDILLENPHKPVNTAKNIHNWQSQVSQYKSVMSLSDMMNEIEQARIQESQDLNQQQQYPSYKFKIDRTTDDIKKKRKGQFAISNNQHSNLMAKAPVSNTDSFVNYFSKTQNQKSISIQVSDRNNNNQLKLHLPDPNYQNFYAEADLSIRYNEQTKNYPTILCISDKYETLLDQDYDPSFSEVTEIKEAYHIIKIFRKRIAPVFCGSFPKNVLKMLKIENIDHQQSVNRNLLTQTQAKNFFKPNDKLDHFGSFGNVNNQLKIGIREKDYYTGIFMIHKVNELMQIELEKELNLEFLDKHDITQENNSRTDKSNSRLQTNSHSSQGSLGDRRESLNLTNPKLDME